MLGGKGDGKEGKEKGDERVLSRRRRRVQVEGKGADAHNVPAMKEGSQSTPTSSFTTLSNQSYTRPKTSFDEEEEEEG